jgi:anti-anti-sigma factor
MSEVQPKIVECPLLVLRVTVPLVSGDPLADALRDEFITRYKQSGAIHIVMDMAAVTYLSSAGIRPLLALNREVREREGRLVLSGLSHDVESVFVATRLVSTSRSVPATFEHADTVPAAVAHLHQIS